MPKKEEKQQSFEESYKTLESLAEELQENQISVDELVPRVQTALSAFKVCRGILKKTESKLTEITAEFATLANDSQEAKEQ